MTGMKFEMAEVKVNMNKILDALSKMVDESQRRDPKFVDESQRRDQKFEELWIRINEDIRTREQRTEARIAGIEKHIDAKIEENFTDLEARMSAVEKNKSGANEKTCREEGTKENPRSVPIEYKAVVHGFKEDSKEEDVKVVVENSIKATGMKDVEYTIDCPVSLWNSITQRSETDTSDQQVCKKLNSMEERLEYRQFLSAEERFHRKRIGYVKFAIVKIKGIALHHIKLNLEMKTITINGQIIANTDENGMLRYNKYEDIDEEVQELMAKWLTKNSSPRL